MTDGENHEDDALAVAKRAAEMGIRIYTIGIGTPEGAPIQIGGEFIKDEKADMVVSQPRPEDALRGGRDHGRRLRAFDQAVDTGSTRS